MDYPCCKHRADSTVIRELVMCAECRAIPFATAEKQGGQLLPRGVGVGLWAQAYH
jgi:hypothetical protein